MVSEIMKNLKVNSVRVYPGMVVVFPQRDE